MVRKEKEKKYKLKSCSYFVFYKVTCAETNRSRPKKIRIVMDQGPTCMTKSYHSLTLKEFQAQWAQRKPVVVTDSLAKSNLEWTPEYFTRNYGKETIEVIDCVSDKAHSTTVEEYFKAFSEPANRKGYARKLGASQTLKVKVSMLFDMWKRQ